MVPESTIRMEMKLAKVSLTLEMPDAVGSQDLRGVLGEHDSDAQC